MTLSLEERFELCRSVAEECVQDDELLELLKEKAHPVCYDGFEPSGRMHIAQVRRLAATWVVGVYSRALFRAY